MTRVDYCSRSGRSSKWIRPEKRQRIYARDQYRCLWCMRRGVEFTLDHFLPRALGGGNEAWTLRAWRGAWRLSTLDSTAARANYVACTCDCPTAETRSLCQSCN